MTYNKMWYFNFFAYFLFLAQFAIFSAKKCEKYASEYENIFYMDSCIAHIILPYCQHMKLTIFPSTKFTKTAHRIQT